MIDKRIEFFAVRICADTGAWRVHPDISATVHMACHALHPFIPEATVNVPSPTGMWMDQKRQVFV